MRYGWAGEARGIRQSSVRERGRPGSNLPFTCIATLESPVVISQPISCHAGWRSARSARQQPSDAIRPVRSRATGTSGRVLQPLAGRTPLI